jgi:hypothetical protein
VCTVELFPSSILRNGIVEAKDKHIFEAFDPHPQNGFKII